MLNPQHYILQRTFVFWTRLTSESWTQLVVTCDAPSVPKQTETTGLRLQGLELGALAFKVYARSPKVGNLIASIAAILKNDV